ncbi:hypothetical protein DEO72_LG7g1496 [Vigna unguiculata]|uniref:Ulp1 protease family n=1 Tax=Vigna unguiculata TaxID=3917 RepID=A0A4D6MJ49_VIGUN|nr:hypothetical protein DEO72_LG7g1496 [Vigna unguiculata]
MAAEAAAMVVREEEELAVAVNLKVDSRLVQVVLLDWRMRCGLVVAGEIGVFRREGGDGKWLVQVQMDWALTQEESNFSIFFDEVPPVKKKKKSELVEKLNENSKLLLKMKADLERMKTIFTTELQHEDFTRTEEGQIEAEKKGGVEAPAKAIDSEEILDDATNEIDVGVKVVVPSKMESGDISITSPCKTGVGEGSPNVGNFGIEEPENAAEGGPSAKEEKTAEEPKDDMDYSLSEDALIIFEALAFVSQQIGDVEDDNTSDRQMCDEDGHDSLEEVAAAMLNEEKVMKIEECDDNPDLLAIVPYVNPSSPLHQQSSPLGEAVTSLSQVPAPHVEKFFLYQIVTSKSRGCLFVEINDQILTSTETRNFAPREWIDNMSILFAATTFMFKEKCQIESISRVIYSPMYTDKFIRDCAKRKAHNLELLFSMLMSPNPKEKPTLKVIIEDLPQQPNLFDCGIMVLKYMEHWEANKKYNGQSMPTYSGAELQQFR